MSEKDKFSDVFDLPYFLNTKDGRRFSRARQIFDALEHQEGISVAKVTAYDFDIAERAFCDDSDDERLLSELAMSCFVLGALVAEQKPDFAKKVQSALARKAVQGKHNKHREANRPCIEKLIRLYQSGIYENKTDCINQEWEACGISSRKAAERALRNLPKPSKP